MTKKTYMTVLVLLMVCLGTYTFIPYEGRQQEINFSEITNITERKEAFFNFLQSRIDASNQEVLALRNKIEQLKKRYKGMDKGLSIKEIDFLNATASTYKILNFNLEEDGFAQLLKKVDVVPASLAAAQAANESAWGTSRFAVDGNNYFGQWCFEKGCGLVPKNRAQGASHEVAAFDSVQQSVQQYMYNINSHKTYQSLRTLRENLRKSNELITGISLAEGLVGYSERGDAYIKEIQAMIRHNNLSKLDFNN